MNAIVEPITSSFLPFENASPAAPRSTFERVIGTSRPDRAEDALRYELSRNAPADIDADRFQTIKTEFGLKDIEWRDARVKVWQDALDEIRRSGGLSRSAVAWLRSARPVMAIGDTVEAGLDAETVLPMYEAVVREKLINGEDVAAVKRDLLQLSKELSISEFDRKSIEERASREAFRLHLEQCLADRRITAEEDAHLQQLQRDLNVQPDEAQLRRWRIAHLTWIVASGLKIAPLDDVPILLQKDELAYWGCQIVWQEMRKHRIGGESVDGLQKIDEGILYFTNQRLVFVGPSQNFSLPLSKLLKFTRYKDCVALEKSTGKTQYIFTDEEMLELLHAVLQRMISEASGKKPVQTPASQAQAQPEVHSEPSTKESTTGAPKTPSNLQKPDSTLAGLLDELNAFVGLESVKAEVRSLANFLKTEQLRRKAGLPVAAVSRHLVFTGNPGTGKTTVARVLAGIYKAQGILRSGHVIETDRGGLVGGYVGQTAMKTQDVVNRALGGVLFIDEAYSLATNTDSNDYGREAVETLLKMMEDHRDDLIVIAAGYPAPMQKFLDANPGLRSRFSKVIDFPDYQPSELVDILNNMAKSSQYHFTEAAQQKAAQLFEASYKARGTSFGNARLARNAFESAMVAQANRLQNVESPDVDALCTLDACDLPDFAQVGS